MMLFSLFDWNLWAWLPPVYPIRPAHDWRLVRCLGIVRALCYWRRLLAIRIRGNRRAWFGCQRRSL